MTAKENKFNFTGSAIERLPIPEKGYSSYSDSKSSILKLYVTAKGVKTFFVRTSIHGRDERTVIGRFPVFTVENARKKAFELAGIIASGKDPKEEERIDRLAKLTFGEHFQDYLDKYSKLQKSTWKQDERDINRHIPHWFKLRLSAIRKEEVRKLHEKIYAENGLYQANKVLVRIRAIFNKAIEWGWQGTNPALGIKKFKEQSRDRFILPAEMPFLLRAIDEEKSNVRDFLYILLLTGARRTNVLRMKWEEINWATCTWRIPKTKSGDPQNVALIERALTILKTRQEQNASEWVFPNPKHCDRPMPVPQSAWVSVRIKATLYRFFEIEGLKDLSEDLQMLTQSALLKKMQEIETKAKERNIVLPVKLLDIRIHDIRRTFGSYQAMTGASLHIIGKSLGHKSSQVTEIYARLSADPIRAAIEKGTDAMFS